MPIWDWDLGLGARCQQPPQPSSTLPTALMEEVGAKAGGGPNPAQTLLAPCFPTPDLPEGSRNPVLSKSGVST